LRVHKSRARATAACSALAALALALAACGSSGSSSGTSATSPIKIGAILALTGGLAPISQADLAGIKVAVNEANAAGGVNGRKLQVVSFDDQGVASTDVGGFRTLAGQGIHLIVGGELTPLCQADFNLLHSLDVLLMNASCATATFTGPKANPLYFRVGEEDEDYVGAVIHTICSYFHGITRYDIMNMDYALTDGLAEVIKEGASQQCGVSQGTDVEVPLTATDMLPYMTDASKGLAADAKSHDVLILNLFGTAAPAAIKLGVSTGLFAKYKYVLTPSSDDTAEIAAQASLGSSMPLLYQTNDYAAALPGSVNAKFVADYKALTGNEPPAVGAEAYRATVALIDGLKKAHSTDPATVAKSLLGLTFPNFVGTETIESSHQGTVPMILHTYGPNGPQYVATFSSNEVLARITPALRQLIAKLDL
jgi:branched-chain amino acid transport system substrate-binding protein